MNKNNSNVLFVVMDTARKKNLTPYGYEKNTTPFLEEFSQGSVVFDNAVSQAPWTLPSHASMFTGKYPSEHGATQESPYLETEDTLASHMNSQGYNTAIFSANAWISPHTGLAEGYERANNFFGALPNRFESGLAKAWQRINSSDRLQRVAGKIVRLGDWIYTNWSSDESSSFTPQAVDSAKDFMRESEDPFFLTMNLLDPHLPYEPPMENVRNVHDMDERPDICQNSKQFNSGARDIDESEWEDIRALYDGELNFLDQQLESLYNWMEERGLTENTLIVVCSDHGELLGEHDLYGHEFGMYEELINVPLMIEHPDMEGRRTSQNVELMDLYHTILNFAGAEDGYVKERCIFHDEYRSESSERLQYPEATFSEYSRPIIEQDQLRSIAKSSGIEIGDESRFNSRMYTVRNDGMKLTQIEHIKNEVFNISEDPMEQDNLQGSYEGELDEMIRENKNFGNVETGESPGIDAVNDSIKDRLSDLGYME